MEILKPERLYARCDQSCLEFITTSDISPQFGTIGQERAMRSLDFGLSLDSKGFNIFILGENGTGKMTTIKTLLNSQAASEPVPEDWCYVYNFKDPDAPNAISMKAGKAVEFQKDMEEAIKTLRAELPKVFESKEYEKARSTAIEEFQRFQREHFSGLEVEAKEKGFSIRKTANGLFIVPVTPAGEPLSEEEFEKLDDTHKKKIEEIGKSLQEKLDDIVRTMREAEKGLKQRLSKIERETAMGAIGHFIEELTSKYSEYPKVTAFLSHAQEDILENLGDFKGEEEAQASPLPFLKPQKTEPTFTRYIINVLVNNAELTGAPCVFEPNPTYYNIFGRVEHKFQYGMAVTDFSMIKPGSLHKANGGYLVIDAMDLLKNIFAYEGIKRSIRNREIRIEDVWEQYRLMSTSTLKPEAIPLDIKVILVGTPMLYYMLYTLDDEYRELFKVKADFDSTMTRSPDAITRYAEFIASKCKHENLMPFDKTGVARVVEFGSRLADHQEKLSSRFSVIADVIREAHYWARKAGQDTVRDEHVETAIKEKIYRSNRIEERMQEMMEDDTIIVPTSGRIVGQINGLAVLGMGDYMFGKPSRITAKTFAGKAGVVNIERETKMSGKIHEKAILIISNYLGSKYAMRKPISLSASITFEQLYEMIEGDSATCAELIVMLSSLSGVPINQAIAITGSMDQNGDVQPIGGVNEKIEGFFDLCAARGLDGTHGVIIPKRNIKHLMLKKEVVTAVSEGKFTIYTISRMEEGLEILTGIPAGEANENYEYPDGTINRLVMDRLNQIATAMKPEKDEKEEGERKDK